MFLFFNAKMDGFLMAEKKASEVKIQFLCSRAAGGGSSLIDFLKAYILKKRELPQKITLYSTESARGFYQKMKFLNDPKEGPGYFYFDLQ